MTGVASLGIFGNQNWPTLLWKHSIKAWHHIGRHFIKEILIALEVIFASDIQTTFVNDYAADPCGWVQQRANVLWEGRT
jgi:hypothetical protein